MVVTPKIIHNPYPGHNFCQCSEQSAGSAEVAAALQRSCATWPEPILGRTQDRAVSGPAEILLAGARARRVFSDDSFVWMIADTPGGHTRTHNYQNQKSCEMSLNLDIMFSLARRKMNVFSRLY